MYIEDQPTTLPAASRIVVIGDIHGDLGRFMRVLYTLQIVSPTWEWIADPKNTIVVQIGDQVDSKSRGDTGNDWESLPDTEVLRVIDSLDRLAVSHGGRVLSLLGNHELMNVMGEFSYVSEKSLAASGGSQQRQWAFRPGSDMARNILARRNVVLKIGRHLFCHGGLLPTHLDMVDNQLYRINDLCRRFLRVQELSIDEYNILVNTVLGDQGILWCRAYMGILAALQPVDVAQGGDGLTKLLDDVLGRTGTASIYVGHTTVAQIMPVARGRLWFVDAAFSRAYGNAGITGQDNEPHVMVLEILNDGASYRTISIKV